MKEVAVSYHIMPLVPTTTSELVISPLLLVCWAGLQLIILVHAKVSQCMGVDVPKFTVVSC